MFNAAVMVDSFSYSAMLKNNKSLDSKFNNQGKIMIRSSTPWFTDPHPVTSARPQTESNGRAEGKQLTPTLGFNRSLATNNYHSQASCTLATASNLRYFFDFITPAAIVEIAYNYYPFLLTSH